MEVVTLPFPPRPNPKIVQYSEQSGFHSNYTHHRSRIKLKDQHFPHTTPSANNLLRYLMFLMSKMSSWAWLSASLRKTRMLTQRKRGCCRNLQTVTVLFVVLNVFQHVTASGISNTTDSSNSSSTTPFSSTPSEVINEITKQINSESDDGTSQDDNRDFLTVSATTDLISTINTNTPIPHSLQDKNSKNGAIKLEKEKSSSSSPFPEQIMTLPTKNSLESSQEKTSETRSYRPLQHFVDHPSEIKNASTTTAIVEKLEEEEIPQSDDPQHKYADNNSKQVERQENKASKKTKSSPLPLTVIVPILYANDTTGNQTRALQNSQTKNVIGAIQNGWSNATGSGVKPRRLESLSYGLRSRISNDIPFTEEEGEEASNSAPFSPSSKSKKLVGLSLGPVDPHNVVGVEDPSSSTIHKTTLQIRRDLSRLVASVVAGGVDDDITTLNSKCDRVYISTQNGAKNGTFEAPTLPPEIDTLYTCMFMFVTRATERVDIAFDEFNVRGTPPECNHEWVDIWTEVEGTDPTDLITTPFSGRYCGKIPPRKRISLYGGIAIGYYTDKNATDAIEPIFRGTYAFVNESRYVVGTPVPRTLCSYTILGSANKGIGELLSPTYPGVYPKNLSCSYKFIGTQGQRIRIEFRDFDVFYGGGHCPFDDVKIYDGPDPTSPLIGTYCGQQRNLVVYSSEHTMLVTFTTLDRNTDSQNRGFNAVYEFQNSFVKLDFIEKNMGDHIRGTECDQRILSKEKSSGVIYSPNYPFPYIPKIVCRYFVYGLQDQQNLERVRLSFEIFDVPSNLNSAEDEINQSEAKRCGDAFLKIYLKGQEVIQAYDKADYEFCGKELPHSVVSDGPRMILVFSSGETQGSGFKGKYTFETEYRVPGTEDPLVPCRFSYNSASRAKGELNSPRFPSNYPSRTNCSYIFHLEPKEHVRIVFDAFKLRADRFNYTDRGAYGSDCEEDWVEIWNVMSHQEDKLFGKYCGSTAPGPIESKDNARALKIMLRTDDEGVYSGFKARYIYYSASPVPFGESCGGNITNAISGDITSPQWPSKYEPPSSNKADASKTCSWYLTVRPGNRVLLHFQQFAVEGDPVSRGCAAAAVRIWEDLEATPVEVCGPTLLAEYSQYVSVRNTMRVTFIMADKAVGAQGFRAVWTEVQDGANTNCHSSFFRCSRSQFCIPMNLKCDGTKNCGMSSGEIDHSDEEDSTCGIVIGDMNLLLTVGAVVVSSLLCVIIVCVWGHRRKRKRRRRLQLRRPPIHVCDNAGARFAAMDSV